ncbi:MAG: hypothetical protein ABFS12_14400 [Bacteroidota bacterium]
MVGKAQLLLVLGFALIFMILGYLWSDLSSRSVDNQVDYYKETIAHNLAVSGANLACSEIYRDQTWNAGFSDLDYYNGEIDVEVTNIGPLLDIVLVTSKGTYMGVTHTVKVKLRDSYFSKFAWYIGNASSKKFITGDTVWGPFHSQSFLNIEGDPAFFGKVSTFKGIKPSPSQMQSLGYNPYFSVLPRSGVDIPYPNNYEFVAEKEKAIEGVAEGGSSLFESTDLWLTFYDNGDVGYMTGVGDDSSTYSAEIRLPLETFAPTGVIYLAKGDIYMSGTLNGKIQIVSGEASGLGNGNVYLVGDMVYADDPMTRRQIDPPIWEVTGSDDMMGLMATNNVRVATSVESGGFANNVADGDIEINAFVFCAQGGVQLQDYNGINTDCGTFLVKGGVVAAKEELIAKLDADGNVVAGFERYVVFDEREGLIEIPPYFIPTGLYEIFSWLE